MLLAPSAEGGQPTTKPVSDFATADQGAKADSALQDIRGAIGGNLTMAANRTIATGSYTLTFTGIINVPNQSIP